MAQCAAYSEALHLCHPPNSGPVTSGATHRGCVTRSTRRLLSLQARRFVKPKSPIFTCKTQSVQQSWMVAAGTHTLHTAPNNLHLHCQAMTGSQSVCRLRAIAHTSHACSQGVTTAPLLCGHPSKGRPLYAFACATSHHSEVSPDRLKTSPANHSMLKFSSEA